MFEESFFGHVRGAYTGAISQVGHASLADLQALLGTLQVLPALTSSQPGKSISAAVVGLPSSGELPLVTEIDLSGIELTIPLETVRLEDVAITGKFIAKQMLFKSPALNDYTSENDVPATPAIEQPELPIINLRKVPPKPGIGGVQVVDLATVPASAIGGVPGLLGAVTDVGITGGLTGTIIGALSGKLKIPSGLPLTVVVQWSLRTGPNPNDPLVSGADHSFSGDLTSPSINVLLRPETFDLLTGDPPVAPVDRYLHARVSVTAGGVQDALDLPAVQLTTVSLGIPRIAAFFAHPNLTGPCLVLVPDRSPVPDLNQFLTALQPLQQMLSALTAFRAARDAGRGAWLSHRRFER